MSLTRFIERIFIAGGKSIPIIFVLVPKNREFIYLQKNIKKRLIFMMPKYSRNFRLGPLFILKNLVSESYFFI